MGLKVGSARIDERGKITGGQAGDSTKKEVMEQNYYMHEKGWYCFRPKDIDTANGIAQSMIDACNNNNIGYDQNQREGVFNLVKKGTKIKNIKTKTECDCSALVRACCYENGIDTGNIRTSTMPTMLAKTGKFEDKISVTSKTELFNGDILVTKSTGHTVVVTAGNPRKKSGTNEIDEDGVWGKETTKKAQIVFGTTVDGIVSNQYSSEKSKNPGLSSTTFEWSTKPDSCGSELIKAIQRKVGAEEDGFIGVETITLMQKWLGTIQDVYVSNPSSMVKAFQKWFNKQ